MLDRIDPMQAATETKEKPLTDSSPQLSRPWNVVVVDDPITTMIYVVKAFMEVFTYPEPKAHRLMMEVHSTGRSIVWSGDREQAELYVHKLHGKHLLAHVEQSDAN